MAYKLSKSGKAKKKKRDLKFAKTTRRTRMKAENQKKRTNAMPVALFLCMQSINKLIRWLDAFYKYSFEDISECESCLDYKVFVETASLIRLIMFHLVC